jgi:hypothetical protein
MARKQKLEKIDVLDLLRMLRREYDSDNPAFDILTLAIRTVEELRIKVEDLEDTVSRSNHR